MKKSDVIWWFLAAIVCTLLALYVLLFTVWTYPIALALIVTHSSLCSMTLWYHMNEWLHREEVEKLIREQEVTEEALCEEHQTLITTLEQLRKSEIALKKSEAALDNYRVGGPCNLENAYQELRREVESVRSELKRLRKVFLDETSKSARLEQELKSMLLILTEVVSELYHAPRNIQGGDLKSLRMRVLDAAYVGFRGLQQFTWATHEKPVEDCLYRDHAQRMLSLGADLSQQWLADYVRCAHGYNPTDGQTGTSSQPRATNVEKNDDSK